MFSVWGAWIQHIPVHSAIPLNFLGRCTHSRAPPTPGHALLHALGTVSPHHLFRHSSLCDFCVFFPLWPLLSPGPVLSMRTRDSFLQAADIYLTWMSSLTRLCCAVHCRDDNAPYISPFALLKPHDPPTNIARCARGARSYFVCRF